jgi:hypothetical protein
MKKPNNTYRKYRKSGGVSLASVFHPVRSLKSVFGYDFASRDAAENLNMGPTREGIQRVVATLKAWGKSYRAPKLSWVFGLLSAPRAPKSVDTRRLEP